MPASRTWISPADSFHGIAAFQDGFSHVLALSANAPLEGIPVFASEVQAMTDALGWRNLIPAKSLDSGLEFKGEAGDRLLGEGVDPTTFSLSGAELTFSVEMPVLVTALGWVDPIFSTLWELCRGAVWGSGSAVLGLLRSLASSGDDTLYVSNIEDFLGLSTPFNATLVSEDGSTKETVSVTECHRASRSLGLSAPLAHGYGELSLVASRTRYAHGPRHEPGVTLLSTQEGRSAPALVNKITLGVEPNRTLSASVEFAALGLDRGAQVPVRAAANRLTLSQARRSPVRLIEGQSVALSLVSSAATGEKFGLTGLLGDPFVAGYQGTNIPEFTVTGIRISVDNRLQAIHTAKGLNYGSPSRRTRDNRFGLTLVSEGRVISGEIKYRSPLTPRAVAERLAGPGTFQGGGVRVNFGGVFVLELTDVTWGSGKGQSRADGLEERTLEFTMVARSRDAMPELLWPS